MSIYIVDSVRSGLKGEKLKGLGYRRWTQTQLLMGGKDVGKQKAFIVYFKMDSELNSVSQNSPFFTPRCRIQV